MPMDAAELESAALTEAAAVHLPRPQFVVDEELDIEMRQYAKSVTEPWKADDYFHPHTFGSWCRRREVYRLLHRHLSIQQQQPANAPASQLLFEAGHAAHNRFRDYLMPKKMLGYWQCQRCGCTYGFKRNNADHSIEHIAFLFQPDFCGACGLKAGQHDDMTIHYVEIPLRDPELMIDGTTDGIVLHRGRLRVCELKSEDPQMWQDRAGLNLGHGMQGASYAHCLNKTYGAELKKLNQGLPINTAAVIYLNKTSYRAKCYIAGTDKLIQWITKEIQIVRTIVDKLAPTIKTTADLDRLELDPSFSASDVCEQVCKHRDVTMAKRCASREVCFSSTFTRKKKSTNVPMTPNAKETQ